MTDEPIHVQKFGAILPVSIELALSYGLITEDEARTRGWTPPQPIPRLRRWRMRTRSWWWDHKPRFHFGPCESEGDL